MELELTETPMILQVAGCRGHCALTCVNSIHWIGVGDMVICATKSLGSVCCKPALAFGAGELSSGQNIHIKCV